MLLGHRPRRFPPLSLVAARQTSGAGTTPPRRRRSDGETTRRRVIDATVESILASGYYHTSSNEIARRAGVTWGTIQHQFGTREALLLDVLAEEWAQLQADVEQAQITGETLEDRLAAVLNLLKAHYGAPRHLAHLQILLDLIQNPTTSDTTRQAALNHGQALSRAWQPLFARALGDAATEEDLVVYAFKALRGYLMGDLVASFIAPSPRRRHKVETDLVVAGVAAAVRAAARKIGIEVD